MAGERLLKFFLAYVDHPAKMKRMTTKNDPMTPEEISETLRSHSLWLECVRANLSYAKLSGAKIYGQVVTSGAVATWNSTYWAMTFQSEVGRILVYGCESRSLVEWNEVVAQLCYKHEPVHADRYEAEIRALVALCETLDMRDE